MIDYKMDYQLFVQELEDECYDAGDVDGPRWHEQARKNLARLRERLRDAEKVLENAAIESFKR